MNKVIGSRERRTSQMKTTAFKSKKMNDGVVLAILSLEERETADKTAHNDFLLCSDIEKGSTIKLPLREFNQFGVEEGSDLVRSQEDGQELYPKQIIIKSSKPRLNKDGNQFYPAWAYNASDDYYDSLGTDDEMSWNELVESGVKEDTTCDPIHDYVIATKF